MTAVRPFTVRDGVGRMTVHLHAATRRRLVHEYRMAVTSDRRRAALLPGDRTNRREARYAILIALEAVAAEAAERDHGCQVSPIWSDEDIVTLTFPANVTRGMCPPVPNCWGASECFLRIARAEGFR